MVWNHSRFGKTRSVGLSRRERIPSHMFTGFLGITRLNKSCWEIFFYLLEHCFRCIDLLLITSLLPAMWSLRFFFLLQPQFWALSQTQPPFLVWPNPTFLSSSQNSYQDQRCLLREVLQLTPPSCSPPCPCSACLPSHRAFLFPESNCSSFLI